MGKLSSPQLDVSVLRQIDKEIPYHIVFLLEHDGKYQAWTAYKESVERDERRQQLEKQIATL